MRKLKNSVLNLWKNTHGQDFIEYALVAGFVATAAGALTPKLVLGVSSIFSKVTSALSGS
jgi:Flp pilus assembly pilin Flp